MQKYIDKAKILIEALPYIKSFNGKTVVIKYGGSSMINENLEKTVIQDIALMKLVGMCPVIVHGGGAEINKFLKRLNKKTEFVNGLRITDEEKTEQYRLGKASIHIVFIVLFTTFSSERT